MACHDAAPQPPSRFADQTSSPAGCAGFSLVELLIAVAIVGILTMVAYPSFMDAIRKNRRSEAFVALAGVQQAQERWRSNNQNYTTDMGTTGLKLPSTTPSGYYTIAISSADATTYLATATPVSGTSQASDSSCSLLVVSMQGGNVSYGSNATTLPLGDANRCWAK